MRFIRPFAIHNIEVPPSSSLVTDRMAALYDQVWGPGGVSTVWEASLPTEIDTASPGPGSYSFLMKRVGKPNAPQFNLRNYGTPASPDSSNAYVCINPDGDLWEIGNSVLVTTRGLAELPFGVDGSSLNNAGINYTENDVLTGTTGTGTPMQIRVDSLGASDSIATYTVLDPGDYTVPPSSPEPFDGGTGSSASLNVNFKAPNQNGALGHRGLFRQAGYVQLLVFEFDDAIIVMSRSSDRTYVISHWGQIIEPEWTSDIDGGGYLTHVGLGIIAGFGNSGSAANFLFTTGNNYDHHLIQQGQGNTIVTWTVSVTTSQSQASWLNAVIPSYVTSGADPTLGWNNFGPDSLTRISAIVARPNSMEIRFGEMKYFFAYPEIAALAQFRFNERDWVMGCSHTSGDTGNIVVPTTEQYDPLVLGTYT